MFRRIKCPLWCDVFTNISYEGRHAFPKYKLWNFEWKILKKHFIRMYLYLFAPLFAFQRISLQGKRRNLTSFMHLLHHKKFKCIFKITLCLYLQYTCKLMISVNGGESGTSRFLSFLYFITLLYFFFRQIQICIADSCISCTCNFF